MRRSVARTVAVAAAALLPLGAAAASTTASAATGPVRPAPSAHLTVASAPTPYGPSCTRQVVPPARTRCLYPTARSSRRVAVNPRDARNVVGVWQQDRWSDGGADALRTG